jgi:hypothetical protein
MLAIFTTPDRAVGADPLVNPAFSRIGTLLAEWGT